jgi:hypothetical protein
VDVEFGSQLLRAEAESGLITDLELVRRNPEHDTVLLKRSLERDGGRQVKTMVGACSVLTPQYAAPNYPNFGQAPLSLRAAHH